MTAIPLTQTPKLPSERAAEYVRILKRPSGELAVLRYRNTRSNPEELIATTCGGHIGRAVALEAAKIASACGLIETIYLDGDV